MKNLKSNNINKNKGFTLIELLVVGVILAILVATAVASMSSNIDETKLDKVSNDMAFIASKMMKCGVAKGGNFTNCNITTLRSREYLDTSWGDGTGISPFGGNYTAAVVAGNTNRFTVASTAIPSDAKCLQLSDRWTNQSVVAPTCNSGTFTFTQGTR
ncbi:MAG: type II secretion system protein [Thalassotalea sp.]|nr:type II secretion system protein [Thalassotalea sp.]